MLSANKEHPFDFKKLTKKILYQASQMTPTDKLHAFVECYEEHGKD